MRDVQPIGACESSAICSSCGIPLDARYFDQSSFSEAPKPGEEIVLARFDLRPEYCGVLEYFSQFTNTWAESRLHVETPDVEWSILANRRPLDPYLRWNYILNPWGYGSFPISLRLDESVVLEFVARGVSPPAGTTLVKKVGGRMVGRYWYNAAYGDVVCHGR